MSLPTPYNARQQVAGIPTEEEMVAIKAHFDGKTIVIPESLRGAPVGDVLVVFDKLPGDLEERHAWMKAHEAAFAKAWDNDEDAVYDSL